MPRHSREDALTEREFELLYQSISEMKSSKKIETQFIMMCAGRMGMRGGEIAHIRKEWIDTSTHTIDIPEYDPCQFGKFDEPCGYCRNRARDYMETHNRPYSKVIDDVEEQYPQLDDTAVKTIAQDEFQENSITFDEAVDMRWAPKTQNSARSIPYDFDVRLQLVFEEFFNEYDMFPKSKCTINRRINTAVEKSPLETDVYPHSLRATAAMLHASRDVSPYSLMSTMGWETLETARAYIGSSDTSAARELRFKYR